MLYFQYYDRANIDFYNYFAVPNIKIKRMIVDYEPMLLYRFLMAHNMLPRTLICYTIEDVKRNIDAFIKNLIRRLGRELTTYKDPMILYESIANTGEWDYSIDKVLMHDLGNLIKITFPDEKKEIQKELEIE